ncbi:hypothetical protein OG225_43465 (plasmid) [Nocardia sp. NBC_01377]|uniref:hypothetical protein n=1 Tax=Nocardia sp. NBC_01377 TaxID=2903595 RepID=UPI002F908D9C
MSRAVLLVPFLSAALLLGGAAAGTAAPDPGAQPSGAPRAGAQSEGAPVSPGAAKPKLKKEPFDFGCDAGPWKYLTGAHFDPENHTFSGTGKPTAVTDLPSNRIIVSLDGLGQIYPDKGRLTVVYNPTEENLVTQVFCS